MATNDKSYIRELGEQIRAKVNPSALPETGLNELFDSYAVLALAKGRQVTNEDVHNAWSSWATKYQPGSDSLVPYEELAEKVQQDDTRFVKAIRAVAELIEKN